MDEEVKLIAKNQSVYIPLGAVHRMESPSKVPMVLIEVQTGSYVGENDIIRYEEVLSQSFFLKNFVLRRRMFKPLECQIIQNFGHTRENLGNLTSKCVGQRTKFSFFDASPNFATEPAGDRSDMPL